jgi:hypothetical protein
MPMKDYFSNHATRVEMETCYTHKAFTWTTDHQYVVLV